MTIDAHDVRLRLCVITDDLRDGREGLVARTLAAERGGATMVVLRLKHADAATAVEVGRALVRALRIPLLVHERLDVALACGAAGVHVSAASMPAVALRQHAPAEFLIGVAIGDDADVPCARGADFVTVGPVFGAGTESVIGLEGLARLQKACGVPAIAVGGIDVARAALLRAHGASGVAVIRAVLGSDDPEAEALALVTAFGDAAPARVP
ncbi:MAG TPA: thiamine phosphate synthase [Gemmatimonadaceae bacterium]|nr:thiamine phosphate synthase [Gemmatimonadaceae bacterium]